MKKNYEYQCPDCREKIEYGDKFCKNCSCKLDWDNEEERDNEIEVTNEERVQQKINSSKKQNKIIRIINLFIFSFLLCMSAYTLGSNLGVYNLNMFGILLATLIDFVLYTFVFMIYPIIIRIKEKKQLSEDYLKKFKTNSIVGAFILAIIIKLVSTPEISAYSIGAFMGYLGRMFVYSIMYFYINKWLFIKNSNKGKNSVISIISLIILIIMFILGIIGFNDNSDDKYYDEDENRLKASHILVDDYSTAKDIINKLNNGGNFCDLVSEYSTDTATSEDCGNIGFFEEGEMVDEFYDAVINLEIGEYTKTPIRTDYGYHIIYRED